MDRLIYLYKLTLSNYMDEDKYNDPHLELFFINFITSNINLLNIKDYSYFFIISLHCELDMLFFKNIQPDSKHGSKIIESSSNYFKLKKIPEIKKLAEKISNRYLQLSKQ